MTCIKFFTGQVGSPATTYGEMHARLPWLVQAREHLRSAIERGNWVQSVTVSTGGWQLIGSTANSSQDQSRFGASMSLTASTATGVGPRGSIYDMTPDNDASLIDTSGVAPKEVQSRKTMPPAEITKHMNTIKLQIEVVEFLHALDPPATATAPGAAAAGGGRVQLPTLFNRVTAREELAAQVCTNSPLLYSASHVCSQCMHLWDCLDQMTLFYRYRQAH